MPLAALQHVFSRQLPQLQVLNLVEADSCERWLHKPRVHVTALLAVSSAEVARIAAACPALCELRVRAKQGTNWAPLQQLPRLSLLHVIGPKLHAGSMPSAAASPVAALTAISTLRGLDLEEGRTISFDDMLQLTALTRLTYLHCSFSAWTYNQTFNSSVLLVKWVS